MPPKKTKQVPKKKATAPKTQPKSAAARPAATRASTAKVTTDASTLPKTTPVAKRKKTVPDIGVRNSPEEVNIDGDEDYDDSDDEQDYYNDQPRKKRAPPGAFPREDSPTTPRINLNPFDVLLGGRIGDARTQAELEQLRDRYDEAEDEGAVLDIDIGGPDQKQRMAEFLREQNRGMEKNIGVIDACKNLGIDSLDDLLPGLDTHLLSHQAIGVSWMLNKERNRRERGGILADDMGLGKTVQAIALMVKNPPQVAEDEEEEWERDKKAALTPKQTLIVAPAALLDQWRDEIETKSDMFTTHVYHGINKAKTLTELRKYDVVITSYNTMLFDQNPRKNKDKKGMLHSNPWYRVILDEAQIIRNRSSQTSIASAKLDATYRWCLTGTPVTNGLADLYPLLRFCRLRPWNDWGDYKLHIASVEKKDYERAGAVAHQIMEKHLLRRTKDATIDGKPILNLKPKTVDLEMVDLPHVERQIYEAVEKRQRQKINNFMKRGSLLKNYQFVLIMILRLRQVCCHPQLIVYAKDEIVADSAEPVVEGGEEGEGDDDGDGDGVDDLVTATRAMGPELVKKLQEKFRKKVQAQLEEKDFPNSGANEDLEAECPICMEVYEDCRVTACGHSFCKNCIEGIFHGQVEYHNDEAGRVAVRPCPNCRADIQINQLFKATLFEPNKAELARIKIKVKQDKEAAARRKKKAASFSFGLTIDVSDEELPSLEDLRRGNLSKMVKKEKPSTSIKKEKKVVKKEESDDDSVIDLTRDDLDAGGFSPKKPKKIDLKGKGKGRLERFIVDSSDEDSMDEEKVSSDDDENTFDPSILDKLQEFELSAKMVRMVELLQQWRDEAPEDKVIVYSQWTSCMNLLENVLAMEGMACIRYDGKMNRIERTEAIKKFKKSSSIRIMLISLKCGGVGLNLVEANRVIAFDLAWNNATENQAYDRVHRLGQNKPVLVKRLVVRDSIEERILKIQESKQGLADLALGEGTGGAKVKRLGMGDLLKLFGM